MQVGKIRAQSEETVISLLATLFEFMSPDRFALFFFSCPHGCGHQTALTESVMLFLGQTNPQGQKV